MLNALLQFGPLVSALSLGGGILAIFSWLDTHFTLQAKQDVAAWLRGRHDWSKIQATFVKAFTITFGKRIVSLQGFISSATISTLTICVLSVVYVLNRREFWDNSGYAGDIDWFARARYIILMAVLVNIPADYVSVVITKFFISITSKARTSFRLSLYVLFCSACLVIYLAFTAIVDGSIG